MASFGLKERAHEKEISLRFLFLAIICWILTLSWIAVIFHFSNQTAAESSNLSHIILKLINDTLNTTIQDDTLIRKAAHSSEFALLTIISYLAISSTNKISNKTSYAESPVKLMRSDNEMNIISYSFRDATAA